MKNKHAFTLIELLAVIVILAIILAIAIPSITNIIESSQVNALKSNERMLLKAAKLYVGTNDSALPVNIGDTKEIALSTLQTNGYLATIKDPIDRTTACNGYVIITKIDTSDYDYTPYLNCENNIGSSTADGLVAHYQFDDMQEPTVNLWNQKQVWHLPADGTTTAISYSINVTDNQSFTITSKQRFYSDDGTVSPRLNMSLNYTDGTSTTVANFNIVKDGEWHTYTVTGTKTAGKTVQSLSGWVLDHSGGTANKHSDVEWIQVEAKGYDTPFYNGTRAGTIKDYSGKGNNSVMALATTPRWMNDSNRGGVYKFDGADDYIDLNDTLNTFGNTGDFSISAWIKSTNSTSNGIITSGYSAAGVGRYGLFSGGVYVRDVNNNGIYASYSAHLDNTWHHITAIYDRTNHKIVFVVDGEQKATTTWDGTMASSSSGILSLGNLQRPADVNAYFYNGSIDDVRLYSRALGIDEIKQLYNSGK